MRDILVGLIVFGLAFGGAVLGMVLGRVLPDGHLSNEARDVIRIVMAMLATLSAVVLGLLTGAAIGSLAEKEAEFRSAGVQFIVLDRELASYGPETSEARDVLKRTLTTRIDQIWPEEGGDVTLAALGSGAGVEAVRDLIFALTPATDKQRWLQTNALEVTKTIAASRWTTFEQIGSRFPWAFFIIVVFWIAIIFVSFGLFAPRNASVLAALMIAALGLSGAVFMILEMDQPYGGVVKISSTPLRLALDQLGKE